jgi:hypothetical protein
VAGFRAAARGVTVPTPPAPRRKRKESAGDGGHGREIAARFSARGIVVDYLNLCRDPSRDLRRWIAEDRTRPGGFGRQGIPTTRKDYTDANNPKRAFMANAEGLRRQPLPELRDGLDADRHGGRGDYALSARPRSGTGGHDQLRPLRAAGAEGTGLAARAGDAGARAASSRGEHSALRAFYAAKIDAARRGLSSRDISAAIRALFIEQSAACRALADRRQAAKAAARDRRAVARLGDRDRRREARAPPGPQT